MPRRSNDNNNDPTNSTVKLVSGDNNGRQFFLRTRAEQQSRAAARTNRERECMTKAARHADEDSDVDDAKQRLRF